MKYPSSRIPLEQINAYAKEMLEEHGRGAHTYDHSLRVLDLCLTIGEEENANVRILAAAALLHDIGRPFEMETGESHAVISGRMSESLLKDIGYSESEIQEVVNAIRTHRFSEGLEPTSLEGRILSDADKLDAIGAIGIYRAIAQSEFNGKGMAGFIEHAEKKLLRLVDLLYTEPAKTLARERHELLTKYIQKLKTEIQEEFDLSRYNSR